MARLLLITDFTEMFAFRLLDGILQYSRENSERWVVCKMPPAYKNELGIDGVVRWALKWKADVVIAQFEDEDDVSLFEKNGILAIAQDYRHRFSTIPNITADYLGTGKMAAEFFLKKGFYNFAFFGYNQVCWSDERCQGFRDTVERSGRCKSFSFYDSQKIDSLWFYEAEGLDQWLKSLPKPVAVMCCDDTQASILLQACQSCGVKTPEDVVVIGVDNDHIMCHLCSPSLTSIDVDIERGGYEVARMASRIIRQNDIKAHDIVLQPIKVCERMSTSVYATKDTNVLKALVFIHQHIEKKINVSDVLEVVPMSRRLLEQRFKAEVGETIYSYISRMRVARFAHLLQVTSDPINEIALRMDEEDSKTLSRRFKELMGCTPLEYRKSAQIEENNTRNQ